MALKHRLGRGHAEDHSPTVGAPFQLRLKFTQILRVNQCRQRSSVLTLWASPVAMHVKKGPLASELASQCLVINV